MLIKKTLSISSFRRISYAGPPGNRGAKATTATKAKSSVYSRKTEALSECTLL
ncbi:MAG TPA: hypothetical protein P5105_02500 [Victivallales bacterium]|nr:hypothetical protein [Victivallales bacterium]HPO90747.1 hypothetical protein [Victivallales bacterium]HRR06130.1 hypothetical protein [Victivallales bacterium]HRR28394.1 hypothetical protein [Victivallales bacterium]HRU00151.1 hypothetical protein [Victivallales bacterium]